MLILVFATPWLFWRMQQWPRSIDASIRWWLHFLWTFVQRQSGWTLCYLCFFKSLFLVLNIYLCAHLCRCLRRPEESMGFSRGRVPDNVSHTSCVLVLCKSSACSPHRFSLCFLSSAWSLFWPALFPFSTPSLTFLLSFWQWLWRGARWCLFVWLICLFLLTTDLEHLFVHLWEFGYLLSPSFSVDLFAFLLLSWIKYL